MTSGCDPDVYRVLSFFIQFASHSQDYFNDFCDDEHGYCGLYDYVSGILADKEKQTPENILNALTGIKIAIDSDEQVKALFEHSVDKLTGFRYPVLVGMLLEKCMEEIRHRHKVDVDPSTHTAKGIENGGKGKRKKQNKTGSAGEKDSI
jgi:hypothetical protein